MGSGDRPVEFRSGGEKTDISDLCKVGRLRPEPIEVRESLRCAECGLPFARLQGGCLVIQSVHGGEKHFNWVSVWDLVLLVVKGLAGS